MKKREVFKKLLAIMIACVAIIAMNGCSRVKDFKVAYGNRTDDPIEAKIDANVLGTVAAGEDRQFVIETQILDSSPTSADYPDVAEVSFSARNLTTGKLATKSRRTIYTDRVEYVVFEKSDFQ